MVDIIKECKKDCSKEGKICNQKTGRCIQEKVSKKQKKSPVPVKKSPVPVKKSPVPVKKSPVPVKKSPVPVKKSPVPVKKSSPVPVKKSPVPEKKSSPKKKTCKENCEAIGKICNHETGRCKAIPKLPPSPIILKEDDCYYNEILNEKKTKCIAMPYSDRYKLFANFKVYFEVKAFDIEKAKEIGAKWDSDKKQLYYTHSLPLGKIYKLNSMMIKKPEKKYLDNENVPYFYRRFAKDAGAHWDPKEKKWYYFDNLPHYNIFMLKNTDWKHFDYRLTFEHR